MKATKKSLPATLDAAMVPASLHLTATAIIDLDALADGASGPALPRFHMVAYTGGPMRIGGWRHPVVIDLAGLAIPSQARPIRFGHDPLAGVGHTESLVFRPVPLETTEVSKRHRARLPGHVLIAPGGSVRCQESMRGFGIPRISTVNSNAMGVPGAMQCDR